jgi:hypothetical protein
MAAPAAVIAAGSLGAMGGAAVVVAAGGFVDAPAGLSDRTSAAAGGLGSGDVGVAAPVGEGSSTGWSDWDVGVSTGAPATAGEGFPTGWFGLGLAAAAGVATAAGEDSTTGRSESGVAAAEEDSTTGWFAFGVAAGGVGVCIPAAAGSVTG